jgi:S-adenosylmethionine:tRNA ribosyltransferase-isomerase
MKTKDYFFNLPENLIAQYPSAKRGDSRLLVLDREKDRLIDSHISEIISFLDKDSVLVLNNSKVRKARLFAQSEQGSTVEFLFLSFIGKNKWQVMTTKSKRQKVGRRYSFNNNQSTSFSGTIVEDLGDGIKVFEFDQEIDENFFLTKGHIPLPPYIKREDSEIDFTRYQTIYAAKMGSVAAPTAGLHFTEELLEKIRNRGITICSVTLHVGIGTFMPVRTENIEDHKMHYEHYEIEEKTAQIINRAKSEKRKIVAVGTTSVRTLESAYNAEQNRVLSGHFSTNLFIKEPYKFKVVDQLLTNFHTPESTLMVLVSSLASREVILKAYKHAVQQKYRFFSYGDAMFIK